jgi:hypothetical protein
VIPSTLATTSTSKTNYQITIASLYCFKLVPFESNFKMRVSFILQSVGTFLLAESILAVPLTPRAEAITTRNSNKFLVGRADADTFSIEIQAGDDGENQEGPVIIARDPDSCIIARDSNGDIIARSPRCS